MALDRGRVAGTSLPLALAVVTLSSAVTIWFKAISKTVPEPYLDEVFHVGQAQTYCGGDFFNWDPKITTPPGVYIASYAVFKLTGLCGIDALRAVNAFFLFCIFLLVLTIPATSRLLKRVSSPTSDVPDSLPFLSSQQVHSALNICLFPPLFFFSGLYYTDVGSTLFVLLFWRHFVSIHSRGTPSFLQSLISVFFGLLSLSFRQTNIFWVGVFPLGLLLVSSARDKVQPDKETSTKTVVKKSWEEALLYNPQIRQATVEDYFRCTISIITRTLKDLMTPAQLVRTIRLMMPYATLLALFGAFVFWNGGVVLGDKSNHVATIHLPQMLYLWAYITFFSLPLTYPFILQAALALLATLPALAIIEPLLIFKRRKLLPRPGVLLGFMIPFLLIVKYNTIIHPFTLADNRHYTFYVFRILLRHPSFKYLAVPLYTLGAWSVLESLGAPAKLYRLEDDTVESAPTSTIHDSKIANNAIPSNILSLNNASAGEGTTVSFVIIWLAVSALQLITAPLVEPRYFILPWLMWRLRLPLAYPGVSVVDQPTNDGWVRAQKQQKPSQKSTMQEMGHWIKKALWYEHDHRLWGETVWFLALGLGTGYIFLTWGFPWPQEPGRTQRFMW